MSRRLLSGLRFPVFTPANAGEVGIDASGRLAFYNGTLSRVVAVVDEIESNSYTFTGTLTTKVGVSKWFVERSCAFESGRLAVNTAPTGAAVICDVNKNGTTIFTTQANRPTIAISGTNQLSTTPDVTTFSAGDYITVDVDQIGSTIAGADLTYTIRLRAT